MATFLHTMIRVTDPEKSRAFYEALGFAVVGRSPVDDMDLPFPILHMRREAPSRTGAA